MHLVGHLQIAIWCTVHTTSNQSLFWLLFPWQGKEISYKDSRFPLLKDMLETIMQVGILEQHSTQFGLSRFVTVTQTKSHVWLETFLVKCGGIIMCVVVRWCFWHYHVKSKLHNFWSSNFLCKLGTRNRNVSKINWKL